MSDPRQHARSHARDRGPWTATLAFLAAATLLAAGVGLAVEPTGDPSPQSIKQKIDEVKDLIAAGKPAKARGLLGEAVVELQALAGADRVPSGARALADLCKSLKDDLELEGIDVTGISVPEIKPKAESRAKPAAKPAVGPKPAGRPAAGGPQGVSFVREVAPVLMTRCGGCHVTGKKGDFQMQSYEGLMKSGVVQRGVGAASRLVEVIETGDMPRGGGKVAPQELALLVRWIDAGAAFDGPDPTLRIDRLAGGAAAAEPSAAGTKPQPAMAAKLKPGEISFAFQIAPVLLKNCAGCHDADQPEARLSMVTFASLVRGGESGTPFVAGQAADSLIVRKIKGSGIEGQRMPIGKPPLSAETITLFEQWIKEGARLDLLTPQDRLETIASAGRARNLSHEELRQARFAAAEKLWRRAIADEEPVVTDRDAVCIVANMPPSRVDDIAAAVDKAAAVVQEQLVGDGHPLLKGGVALFPFAKAYDYSSFWETSLARPNDVRPKGQVSHAGVVGDVAYGAFIVPSGDGKDATADLAAVAAEQIAAAALAARGAPEWFARGAGRTVGAKASPGAAIVKAWKHDAIEALHRLSSAEDFLGGQAGPAATAAIAGGFVGALAPAPAKLRAVVEKLDDGTSFDAAFSEVFRGTPQQLFAAWAAKESRKAR